MAGDEDTGEVQGDRLDPWLELVEQETRGRRAPDLASSIGDGIVVHPLYTSDDLTGLQHLDDLPGFAPFVRGVRATMYTNRHWTIRQYAGFSTAEETNHHYKAALAHGQTGLSVAFDLATHRGYDSDHERVVGDVGKAGVAIDTVEDMARLFDGIDLSAASVSMTMNGAVAPVMACFIVAAEEQGVPAERLSGTIQNDILKELIVRNTYVFPPEASLRVTLDVIEHISREMPRFNPVSISGYHMQEAGATPAMELAFTLADALEYVRGSIVRGLAVDDFAPRLSFFFGIGMDLFTEVAKLRAARLLWSELMATFEPTKPESSMLRTHCQTSGVSLIEQDPLTNVVRTAYEALAAVLGGTQSLHTNAFDEALALPSDEAARLARATQLILAHETGVSRVVDPLGGSYYVERLTHEIADAARNQINEIEMMGGMAKAIAHGTPKARIEEAAARRQARIERGDEVIVGVNRFTRKSSPHISLRSIDTSQVREAQIERLADVRAHRDQLLWQASLDALEDAARGDGNLLEACIVAARARATVGEMTDAMERVFGRHRAEARSVAGVYAAERGDDEDFIATHARVVAAGEQLGRRPRVLIAKLGQDGHDRGAHAIAGGLADLGFDVELGALFATPEEVARQAISADVHVIGISSLAGAHLTLVPQLIDALKVAGATDIAVVIGGIIPPNDEEPLHKAGVAAVLRPGGTIVHAAEVILDVIERQGT